VMNLIDVIPKESWILQAVLRRKTAQQVQEKNYEENG